MREPKAALEAKAQAQAAATEAERKSHPWVPEGRAERKFSDPESRIMPGPGARDFQESQ